MVVVPPAAPAVSVLLAFPHARMRAALVGLLAHEPGLDVVGSAGDAATAALAMRKHRPAVVVADLSLVSLDGALLQRWGPVDVAVPVVVTSFEAPATIEARLRQRGAAAYVSKEHLVERLPVVLREIGAARRPAAATA